MHVRLSVLGKLALSILVAGCGQAGGSDDGTATTGWTATTDDSSGEGTSTTGASGSTTSGGAEGTQTTTTGGTDGGGTTSGGSSTTGGTTSGGAETGPATESGGGTETGTGTDGGDESGDVVGKITVGYQAWFTAASDGSGINWWHVTGGGTPSPTNIFLKSWPDNSEYATTYPTDFPALGNGDPAVLFSSYDASTIDTQVRWASEYGIDTLALQRFGDYRQTGEARNVITGHVRAAAEKYDRKFYIMYDITGWDSFATDIPQDWQQHLIDELNVLDSSAYAHQDGKPVVCIWGLGYTGNHPGTPETQLGVVDFFKDQGFYVIGGVGNDWRVADGTRWSQAGFESVYEALDAISPWMVGVIGDANGSDSNRETYNEGDVQWCRERGIHYQPCVLPGDLQEGQRRHGDFMWHQFANMIEIGADGIYVSMYDEYNESNQIAKTAATSMESPTGEKVFATLDEDGTACSSDYYLRLTRDGGRMLKGEIPFTWTRPTSPI